MMQNCRRKLLTLTKTCFAAHIQLIFLPWMELMFQSCRRGVLLIY
ncbi:hypothetical protein NC653_037062 [Populus alba x Populus x berolinensis]|uniref:Uncharacterized protein n=1 Tax=Populus alba x Populus x berolinensis TaxID=444605 RepID=A0AAD6PX73_9ROSI|nr:hypothetical protein NC653_037062 [Populus alba x Populus x berolinensis]